MDIIIIVPIDAPFCCRFAVDTIYIKIIMMREWLQEVYLCYYIACCSTRQYNNYRYTSCSHFLIAGHSHSPILPAPPPPQPHPQKFLPVLQHKRSVSEMSALIWIVMTLLCASSLAQDCGSGFQVSNCSSDDDTNADDELEYAYGK